MTSKILNPVFLCTECKSIHHSLDEMYFVEENSSKGFCSENCIETFYRPLLEYYEKIEFDFRKELNLLDEIVLFGLSDEELMSRLIQAPDEIYKYTNPLGEELYTYIKLINKGYFTVLCTSFKNEPSYIFLTIKTISKELLDRFKIGEKLLLEDRFKEHNLEEIIENKKSEILANLITLNNSTDIQIEDYYHYDHFFEPTLQDADEIYEFKDQHGDVLLSYIKTFEYNQKALFFIVVCIKSDSKSFSGQLNELDQIENQMTIFPVIGFPTQSSEIYGQFKKGRLLSGKISN